MPARLREMILGLNEELTGSRLLRGMVCLGGVRRDWKPDQLAALPRRLNIVEREFRDLVALIKSSDSTRDRLERTGILRPEKAEALGIVGVGGRASGVDLDVRRDHPYAAYDRVSFQVPVYQEGDVWHRMQVRIDEVAQSLGMIRAVARLPAGVAPRPVRKPSAGPLRAERRGRLARRDPPLGAHGPRTTGWSAARSRTPRSTTGRRWWRPCRATSSPIFR